RDKEQDSVAVAEMKQFIIDYPESRFQPQAHFMIGDSYYNMQQYDSAYVYYRKILDTYPNSSVVPEALDAIRFTLDALGRGRDAVVRADGGAIPAERRRAEGAAGAGEPEGSSERLAPRCGGLRTLH